MSEPKPTDLNRTQSAPLGIEVETETNLPQTGDFRPATLETPISLVGSTEARFPQIKGYEITSEIARGGMGRVLAGVELSLNREVAIKVLLPGAKDDRFVLESQITARLPHPNIPPVHALGTLDDGSPYLVMKRIRGEDLAKALKKRQDPKEGLGQWLQVFELICQAVGFAHARGIIHRDLKPANVMVGEFGEVQVMDWGLAKDLKSKEAEPALEERRGNDGEELTVQGAVMGTPSYMAPEQARGETLDSRADVFALGGILCAILTGRAPFSGGSVASTLALAAQGKTDDAIKELLACGADLELIEIASKCLAVVPKDRPKNGQAVADLAQEYREGVEARLRKAEATRAADLAKTAEQAKRRKALQLAGAVILVVSIIGIGVSSFFAWRSSERAEIATKAQKNADTKAEEADRERIEAKRQEGIANEKTVIAEQERIEAKKQEGIAKVKTTLAEDRLSRNELSTYSGKLLLAQAAYEKGNLKDAFRHLDDCQWNLREWEHAYLRRKFGGSVQTLHGHSYYVKNAIFTADGKQIITTSGDSTIRLWDAEKGIEIRSLKIEAIGISDLCLGLSPDGKRIVLSVENTATIRNLEKGAVLHTLKGHTQPITSVSFNADGKRVLTSSFDKTAKLWNAETGDEIQTFKGHAAEITCANFSRDGKRVLTGSNDTTAKIWDTEKGTDILTIRGHTAGISGVDFSPDGQTILTGSYDKTAKLWNATTGDEIRTFKDQSTEVIGTSFSPDGRFIANAGADNLVKLWNVKTGEVLRTFKGHSGRLNSVAFSPNGQRIITSSDDFTVKTWDIHRNTEPLALKGHSLDVLKVHFTKDGKRIVSSSQDRSVKIWDAETGTEIATHRAPAKGVGQVWFSPDGKRMAANPLNNSIRITETETGTELYTLKAEGQPFTDLIFGDDGRFILTPCFDRTARLWDAQKGTMIQTFKGHTELVSCAAYSRDGKRLITGGNDNTAKLWNIETGKEIFTLKGHSLFVGNVCFSPDEKYILTGGGDFVAKVWDAEKGTELFSLKGHTDSILSAKYSPDGKRIITAGLEGNIKVWDAQKGIELLKLVGPTGYVKSIDISSDGKRIVSGGLDRSVHVWDIDTSAQVLFLKGHFEPVTCINFSSDGKTIVTGGIDKTVRLWDTEKGTETHALRGHDLQLLIVAISPDNKTVFGWDLNSNLLAWDTLTGTRVEIANVPPRPEPVTVNSPDKRFSAKLVDDTVILFDAKRPGTEWPLPDAAQRKNYHTQQAEFAEKEKLFFTQAFHLTRLLADDPKNKPLEAKRNEALKKHEESSTPSKK